MKRKKPYLDPMLRQDSYMLNLLMDECLQLPPKYIQKPGSRFYDDVVVLHNFGGYWFSKS